MLRTYKYILELHGEIVVKYTTQFTLLTRSKIKTHHKIIIHLIFYLNNEIYIIFHCYELIFKFYVVKVGFK
jgi:hypothetical protein